MSRSRVGGAESDVETLAVEQQDDASEHEAQEVASEADQPERPSRRRFFLGAAAAAAGAALLPARKAQGQRISRPRPGIMTRPGAPGAVSEDVLVRLVNRVTSGATEEEVKRAKSMGFSRYLEYQLKYTAIGDSATDSWVAANCPTLAMDGPTLYATEYGTLVTQLWNATTYRSAFSKRQLYERMVEFWTDHFSINYEKVGYLKTLDDREVIRKHALGKFPTLLKASAHSPAMLEYLDNTRSRGRNTNQNYAREIMELHTLGVDGGYTQQDVAELSRILTGWTIQGRGNFAFDPTGHDFTAKTFLGEMFPAQASSVGAAAIQEGERAIDMLLAHPNTAKYISMKMLRWLLRYDPSQSQIDALAQVYTKTGGDIPSMIRAILTPANLREAPLKMKRPYHFLVSSLRAVNPTVRTLAQVSNRQLLLLGQQLFYWDDPDGYPDNMDFWAGTILARWNFASYLTSQASATGEVTFDVTPLVNLATPVAITGQIEKMVFAGNMPSALEGQISAYLSAAPVSANRVREAMSLALSSNAFQWY
jgi:uncharacterized protein (DUF1800 family)